MDFVCSVSSDQPMADTRDDIVRRLRILPEALGKKVGEIAAAAGVSPNQWSNYIADPDVRKDIIPYTAAAELRATFNLTLDWIYCGDPTTIRDEALRIKLRRAERAARLKRSA